MAKTSSLVPDMRVYSRGAQIWVPDDGVVWRRAEFLEYHDSGELQVKLHDTGETVLIKPTQTTHLCNVELFTSDGVDSLEDLTQLPHLHEAAVLNSLNMRFDADKIYTFTGPILIAVNPFKTISDLYDLSSVESILNSTFKPTAVRQSPHVFASAASSFRGLSKSKKSQTILISGESGAGKTESTKFVMKFLALAGSAELGEKRSQIENQVLQSNPLLETLGNAKTLRNENSSRFGKFIEMQFNLVPKLGQEDLVGRLVGARIHTYLLETVRVCHQLEEERNYHSFYQVCAAAAAASPDGKYKFPSIISIPPESKSCEFDLKHFSSFDKFLCLTQSSCSTLNRISDLEEFEYTILAMQTIGIAFEDQVNLINLIGGILHLGNILIVPDPENTEGSLIAAFSTESLSKASTLLGLTESELRNALTIRTLVAHGDEYKIALKVREAGDVRDALMKALYGTAFLKIVDRTNQSIGYKPDVDLFCGVLDIFGFECFQVNSFEQLCINFTNERLQQFFNTFIFKFEEKLYDKEGIPWSVSDFPDNQDCVILMDQKASGLFAMLDEECMVPRGTDQGFCNKIKEKYKNHKRLGIIKTQQEWFIINHFAGPVNYCSTGFLDKNRDQLSLDAQKCVLNSKVPFIRTLFEDFLNRGGSSDEPKAAKKRQVTVSGEFRNQLNYLLDTVIQTEPHFIRCIKPNSLSKPDQFDRKGVTEQLRYGGVLQAVEVSRAGYPIRLSHQDAWLDWRTLCERNELQELQNISNLRERANKMMKHLETLHKFRKAINSSNSWAVGETLVFFKHESYESLTAARVVLRNRAAIYIQSRLKSSIQRKYFLHFKACTLLIQAHIRGFLARKMAQGIRETQAAIFLQRFMRRTLLRISYMQMREGVIAIQSAWRNYAARQLHVALQRESAAIIIQKLWKGWRSKNHYLKLRRGVLMTQRRWRQIRAKKCLRRLRKEKREAKSLVEANKQLSVNIKQLEINLDYANSQYNVLSKEHELLKTQNEDLMNEISQLRNDFQDAQKASEIALLNQESLLLTNYKAQVSIMQKSIEKEHENLRDVALASQRDELEQIWNQKLQTQEGKLRSEFASEKTSLIDNHEDMKNNLQQTIESLKEHSKRSLADQKASLVAEYDALGLTLKTEYESREKALRSELELTERSREEILSKRFKEEEKSSREKFEAERTEFLSKLCYSEKIFKEQLESQEVALRTEFDSRIQSLVNEHCSREAAMLEEFKDREAVLMRRQSAAHVDSNSPSKKPPSTPDTSFGASPISDAVTTPESHIGQSSQLKNKLSRSSLHMIYIKGFSIAAQDIGISQNMTKDVGGRELQNVVNEDFNQIQLPSSSSHNKGQINRELKKRDEVYRRKEITFLKQNELIKSMQKEIESLKNIDIQMKQQIQDSNPADFSFDIFFVGETSKGFDSIIVKLIRYGVNDHNTIISNPDDKKHDGLSTYKLRIENQVITIGVLSGIIANEDLRNWISRARSIVIIYDVINEDSYRMACDYLNITSQHPNQVLFGNTSSVSLSKPIMVDHNAAKRFCTPFACDFVQGDDLMNIVTKITNALSSPIEKNTAHQSPVITSSHYRLGLMMPSYLGTGYTPTMGRINHYFGAPSNHKRGGSILYPSMSESLEPGGLQPVIELPESPAAITCIAFGQESCNQEYSLIAAACKDGSITIYRIYRTSLEKRLYDERMKQLVGDDWEFPHSGSVVIQKNSGRSDDDSAEKTIRNKVEVAQQLLGHSRAITQLLFSFDSTQLISSSIDKSVRFWDIETGDMQKVLADSAVCIAVVYIPFNPSYFIVSNANCVLRVVDVRDGRVLQRVKMETEVRALTFDETGLHCIAGSRNGVINVLEAKSEGTLDFKIRYKVAKASITCVTYVPSRGLDAPPVILVNSCDNTISVVHCIFGQPAGILLSLSLVHKLKNAHSLLPIRNCFSSAGGGWLISASEDRLVYAYSMAPGGNYECIILKRHQAPVVTVAVNKDSTILASADSCGKLILWRWLPDIKKRGGC